MADETRTGTQHHPDTRRDFETGTVNPGPGMAGPLSDQDANPGKETDPNGRQSPQHQAEKTGRQAEADDRQKGGSGSCGCG